MESDSIRTTTTNNPYYYKTGQVPTPIVERLGQRPAHPQAHDTFLGRDIQESRWRNVLGDYFMGSMFHDPTPEKVRQNIDQIKFLMNETPEATLVYDVGHHQYDNSGSSVVPLEELHSNALIIDPNTKRIILYEPHGFERKTYQKIGPESVHRFVEQLADELPDFTPMRNIKNDQVGEQYHDSVDRGLCDTYSLIFAKHYVDGKLGRYKKMENFDRWIQARHFSEALSHVSHNPHDLLDWATDQGRVGEIFPDDDDSIDVLDPPVNF
jgi:hypothetical protein